MWWPIGNKYEAFESNFHPFETQSQSKRLQDGAQIAQEAHTFGISICFVCVDQGWEDSVYVDLSQPFGSWSNPVPRVPMAV